MKKSYSEKLKDPRWQRKRLEVLQAQNFTCQECFSKEKTLHVHHRRYIKGRDPWDYDATMELQCLCEDCHATREKILEEVGKFVGKMTNDELTALWMIINDMRMYPWSLTNMAHFFKGIIRDFECAHGVGSEEEQENAS